MKNRKYCVVFATRNYYPMFEGFLYKYTKADWDDVTLNSYMVFDANINYAFNNESKIFVRCENIFDEKYEQSFQYNTPGRGLFVGYTSSF